VYDVVVTKFTFAVSSRDELPVIFGTNRKPICEWICYLTFDLVPFARYAQ